MPIVVDRSIKLNFTVTFFRDLLVHMDANGVMSAACDAELYKRDHALRSHSPRKAGREDRQIER